MKKTVYFYEVVDNPEYYIAAYDEESARELYAYESEIGIDEVSLTLLDMNELVSWGFLFTHIEPVMKEYFLYQIAGGLNPAQIPFTFIDFSDLEVDEESLGRGDKMYE